MPISLAPPLNQAYNSIELGTPHSYASPTQQRCVGHCKPHTATLCGACREHNQLRTGVQIGCCVQRIAARGIQSKYIGKLIVHLCAYDAHRYPIDCMPRAIRCTQHPMSVHRAAVPHTALLCGACDAARGAQLRGGAWAGCGF